MVFAVTLALVAGSALGPTETALFTALDLERQGDAMRVAAIARFGSVEPLKGYRVKPEGVPSLVVEFERRGVSLPQDPYAQGKAESSRAWATRLGLGRTLFETVEAAAKFEAGLATVYAGLAGPETSEIAEIMATLHKAAKARGATLERFVGKQCCGG